MPVKRRKRPRTPAQLAHFKTLQALNKARKGQKLTKLPKTTDVNEMVVAKSQEVRAHLSKDLAWSARNLVKLKGGKSISGLKERAEVQALLAQVSDKVFAWSDVRGVRDAINLNVLTMPAPQPTSERVAKAEVIDVQEVKGGKESLTSD